jgi:transposase-like protein
VFVNENKDCTYNSSDKKLREVLKINEDFGNHYHKFYQCQHCGRTYNNASDKRVTKVFRDIKKLRGDTLKSKESF